MSLQTV